MIVVGDVNTWLIMLGIVVLLCVYWVAKWIISLWTGS
jgi:hypothetical protein